MVPVSTCARFLSLPLFLAAILAVISSTGCNSKTNAKKGAALQQFAAPERHFADMKKDGGPTGEEYERRIDNSFHHAVSEPLSTFSIDVDRASYANVRRFLSSYRLPPKDAVRIEELVNYFDYDYPDPEGDAPFSVSFEQMECPWKRDHRLVQGGGERDDASGAEIGELFQCHLAASELEDDADG